MPSINSARYAQRIIQTESHESPSFLRKVHRLDPPSARAGREEAERRDLDAEAISDLSNQTKIGIPKYLSPMSHMFPTSSIEFVYIRSMYRIVVRERRLYNTQNFIMVSLRGRK